MSFREWGITALLLASGCAVKEQQSTQSNGIERAEKIPHVKIDDYDIAMDLKNSAEIERNQYKRESLFKRALEQFKNAREHGTRPLDSLIQEADIHSLMGDQIKALDIADKYIQQNPKSSLGWFEKGIIDQRHGCHAYAVKNLTRAIELEDLPDTRWARCQSYLTLSITDKGNRILPEHVKKALEDINKYVESRKEEPDGYFYKAAAQCMLEKATNNKPDSKEAYETFKQGMQLFNEGKELRRAVFNKERILEDFIRLKKVYEPESPKAQNKSDLY